MSADLLPAVEHEVTAADLALMVHTSGTTAAPKAVLHTHGVLCRQSIVVEPGVRDLSGGQDPRYLCAMPFFWIGGILNLAGALHAPMTVLALDRLDPSLALALVERERGTAVIGWPTLVQPMRAHPDFATRDLRSAPGLLDGPADLALVGVPAGRPRHRAMSETAGSFLHTDVGVWGADGPVADGHEGELRVRGPGLMVGYNKRERHEVFDADGWYRTGDRVVREDGVVYFVGRDSDLIKAGGANVAPREVEVVLEDLPEIEQACVFGEPTADGGEQVVAVVVPAEGTTFDEAQVRDGARRSLSAYKVPRRWVVLTADRIPLLATGKPDRRALMSLAAST